MEAENQYLTYEEYKELGGNQALTETPFNLLEFEIRQKVDKYTFGRLKTLTTQSNEVKACVFQLINTVNYNIEFKNGTPEERNSMEKEIINDMLANYKVDEVPVLFRGI